MERMVAIYCRDHHRPDGSANSETRSTGTGICPDCVEFLAYAEKRLAKCPYGSRKPTCAKCPIHCYRHAQRERAREIMRYAGPRMLTRHPWLALMHVADKFRPVRHPMEIRRRDRSRRI
jgi:hypothetical protein